MASAKEIDRYVQAATRENTRRSYQSAVQHYEVSWGGFLPATADSIARYLVDHAETLAINTLKQRLAALARWHVDQGFPDPTKAPLVKQVLKGIRELHPEREKQATPVQLQQLERVADWLEQEEERAVASGDAGAMARCCRDRALILLGFWRAFRSDELCRLRVEHIDIQPDQGMTLFLHRTKGDRNANGTSFPVPALSLMCPVAALEKWMAFLDRPSGALFCGIDRWGRLSQDALHPNSVIPLLRTILEKAGITDADVFSSHSLRRGFATWANDQGWDVKTLMNYVGWKDVKSAMRYIDVADPFARHGAELALPNK